MGKYDSSKGNTTGQRSKAVRDAWARERDLVSKGMGTRDWTPEQQRDILNGVTPKDENGRPFEGHHMYSVNGHEEHAGNADDIQFLTHDEHINGAHGGSTRNPTEGRYDPATGETTPFEGNAPSGPEAKPLSDPVITQGEGTGSEAEPDGEKNTTPKDEENQASKQEDTESPGKSPQPTEEITQDHPEEVPQDHPEEVPQDRPEEVPQDHPEEVPQDHPDEAALEAASEQQNSTESTQEESSMSSQASGAAEFETSVMSMDTAQEEPGSFAASAMDASESDSNSQGADAFAESAMDASADTTQDSGGHDSDSGGHDSADGGHDSDGGGHDR